MFCSQWSDLLGATLALRQTGAGEFTAGSVPEDQPGESTHRIVIVTPTHDSFQNVSVVCHKRDFVIVGKYWRMQATRQTNHYYKQTETIKWRFEEPNVI